MKKKLKNHSLFITLIMENQPIHLTLNFLANVFKGKGIARNRMRPYDFELNYEKLTQINGQIPHSIERRFFVDGDQFVLKITTTSNFGIIGKNGKSTQYLNYFAEIHFGDLRFEYYFEKPGTFDFKWFVRNEILNFVLQAQSVVYQPTFAVERPTRFKLDFLTRNLFKMRNPISLLKNACREVQTNLSKSLTAKLEKLQTNAILSAIAEFDKEQAVIESAKIELFLQQEAADQYANEIAFLQTPKIRLAVRGKEISIYQPTPQPEQILQLIKAKPVRKPRKQRENVVIETKRLPIDTSSFTGHFKFNYKTGDFQKI